MWKISCLRPDEAKEIQIQIARAAAVVRLSSIPTVVILIPPEIWKCSMITGILLDLGGVVFVGDEPIPGALDAISRLRSNGMTVRFITNTTRQSLRQLLEKLRGLGVAATAEELFMPAIAARRYMRERNLTPHLLVHPNLVEDFAPLPRGRIGAVVVGDAGESFTYPNLNSAYRLLNAGAEFLALANNRSFRDGDGELSLDAGPFVTALEYATSRTATLFGKPSATFFREALASMERSALEVAMIGDDVEADVAGAMAVGLAGILVRTGKYAAGDESKFKPPPTAVVADLSAAASWVLAQSR
jgi:HAD superfamily hydrolase (TIGR01458 family)